jgi:hypothetical protein
MAIANSLSNNFKRALMNKEIDIDTDSFKIALVNTSFAFDPGVHDTWADVSASEIAAGFGYTAGGQVLQSGELVQNDTTDKAIMTWQNAEWLAVGGNIADTGAAIIYDNTHASKVVVGCSDFGVNYSTVEGMSLKFVSIAINLG